MKKALLYIVTALLIVFMAGCSAKSVEETEAVEQSTKAEMVQNQTEAETPEESEPVVEDTAETRQEIKIIYTNDIHSYIYNTITDQDNNVTPGLRLSNIAAMKNDIKAAGENVLLVDAGDSIQGTIYGSMDEGRTIIKLMNDAGYDLAAIGNHEFDYGLIELQRCTEEAEFPYICCNFKSVETGKSVYPGTYVFDFNGTKVAFVGISTPDSMVTSTPVYFQNEKGEFIFSFDGGGDVNQLYKTVQENIDSVRNEADYVIALGHLGIGEGETKRGISSTAVIQNTKGLDAFIDGHSHSVVDGQKIKDKEGKEVLLTQTGSNLQSVGFMTISSNGDITTELLTGYDGVDEKTAKTEKDTADYIDSYMGETIAVLGTTMYISNPQNPDQRLIRAMEMNSGDFITDSMYWFFNERMDQGCDIAITNGGGIRNSLEKGDISIKKIKEVMPFGNQICLVKTTGRHILDALEMGASDVGAWDDQWDSPAENGGFMHVAGMKYTIDPSIPSTVKTDSEGRFVSVDGEYRVKDLMVYNRKTGKYEPIDMDGEYTVGGINYILRNGGNGLIMFDGDEMITDFAGQDADIQVEYIKSFDKKNELPYISTETSPLSKYPGYELDYENPYGSGRITIAGESNR